MRFRLALVTAVIAVPAATAAYAAGTFPIPPLHPADATPMQTRPALYSCGDLPSVTFPKRRLLGRRGAERADSPSAGALREELAAAAPDVPRRGWRLLAQRANVAAYAHDALRDPLQWLAVVRAVDGEWRLGLLGRCTPQRIVRGFAVMTWTAHGRLSRTSTRIAISVRGGGCHRSPRDLRRVEVSYARGSVNVLVLFRAITHPKPPPNSNVVYACPADLRFFHYDVRLPSPLGSRALADARTWPPKQLARARG